MAYSRIMKKVPIINVLHISPLYLENFLTSGSLSSFVYFHFFSFSYSFFCISFFSRILLFFCEVKHTFKIRLFLSWLEQMRIIESVIIKVSINEINTITLWPRGKSYSGILLKASWKWVHSFLEWKVEDSSSYIYWEVFPLCV